MAARTSSFRFSRSDADVTTIGRRLGVANLLEGSVPKEGDRVRLAAQLVDARTGYHRWSGTYDRKLENVFAVQDEVTRAVVQQLEVHLLADEGRRLSRAATDDPEAYEAYLRGMNYWYRRHRVGLELAKEQFERAVELDPEFPLPWAYLGSSDGDITVFDPAAIIEVPETQSVGDLHPCPDLSVPTEYHHP